TMLPVRRVPLAGTPRMHLRRTRWPACRHPLRHAVDVRRRVDLFFDRLDDPAPHREHGLNERRDQLLDDSYEQHGDHQLRAPFAGRAAPSWDAVAGAPRGWTILVNQEAYVVSDRVEPARCLLSTQSIVPTACGSDATA